jgi:hypothetical protein
MGGMADAESVGIIETFPYETRRGVNSNQSAEILNPKIKACISDLNSRPVWCLEAIETFE